MKFKEIFEQYWKWAESTFNTSATEAVKGLKREVDELSYELNSDYGHDITDILEESADVLFYVFYIVNKVGGDFEQLKNAMDIKLEQNIVRRWEKDETGCFSHVKEESEKWDTTGLSPRQT